MTEVLLNVGLFALAWVVGVWVQEELYERRVRVALRKMRDDELEGRA